MSENLRDKIYERLDYYSDRFKERGPCGAKTTGCRDLTCLHTNRHYTDKNLYHTYANFYAEIMSSIFNENDFAILELGVAQGGSLAAWCESMPSAFVCGVDNKPERIIIDVNKYKNIKILTGQHGDPSTYSEISDKKFDVIIDDGSHQAVEQIENFYVLKNLLKPGGYYVIEDIYPENTYSADFLKRFELLDFSNTSGRFDDKLMVYKND